MTESNEILAYRVSEMERRFKALEESMKAEIHDLEEELKAEVKARQDAERRNLKTGISMLGLVLTTVTSVLWAYRGVIFK